jgi:hypothetical protein
MASRMNVTGGATRGATLIVAASDSTAKEKAGADYICDGTNDNVEINAAIDALPATGGRIILSSGTFSLGAAVALHADCGLEGQGSSTVLSCASDINPIYVADIRRSIVRNITLKAKSSGQTNPMIYIYCSTDFVMDNRFENIIIRGGSSTNCSFNGIQLETTAADLGIGQNFFSNINIGVLGTAHECVGTGIEFKRADNTGWINNNFFNIFRSVVQSSE